MKRILLLLCAVSMSVFSDWTVLKNCHLAESESNDADSFLVECDDGFRGETKNRFRLYFVDAAETDRNSDFKRERLKEQAAYWGSDDPDFALQMGLRASQTVSRMLRKGFTLYTQGEYAPTMGAPRYYALLRVKNQWLDEILVSEGLVRIYGNGSTLPDGSDAKGHWRKLHELERIAKEKKMNGWRNASAGSEEISDRTEFERYDTIALRDVWIYSTKDGRKITVIGKGTSVSVIAVEEGSRLRIRFEKNGAVYEGLCEKGSLR